MKRGDQLSKEVNSIVIDDSSPTDQVSTDSYDVLIKKAELYQNYMSKVPLPSKRGSVIPFTSWVGLSKSMKQLYGQPLHYLTNIQLKQWDRLRIGSRDEDTPLDFIIHPSKAEVTIWLLEETHRLTASHHHLAKLWHLDSMYHAFIDPAPNSSWHW